MSITSSLNNALSGLNVTSRMANVVSNNLANALTEGYGRRELETSSYAGGVRVDGITRAIDRGILSDRRLAEAQLNADQRTAGMLGKIENIMGVPGDEDSLSMRLAAFESALVSAASDPSSDQRLQQVGNALKGVVTKLHDSSVQIQNLREDSDLAIKRDVDTLNSSLRMLERLNADISRARNTGQDVSSLLDSRQQVVDEIGGIVPVRELDRGKDQLGLMTTSGLILIDGKASQFSFQNTPTIVADMTLQSGGLSGIELNGVPLDGSDGFGRLAGGSLAASFQLRDEALTNGQKNLDEFSLELIDRFARLDVDPSMTGIGLLTDGGQPADPLDIVGLSSRVSINASLDPFQGGALSNWRDGTGATSMGPTGDPSQLNRWRGALTQPFGANRMSAAGHVDKLASEISMSRVAADRELSFTAARWDSLHNAELAGGVDSDVELQNLLKVEQAYAANAKVIQTISAMMQQIMEI